MKKRLIFFSVFFLLLSGICFADLVHLKKGKVIEGEIISETSDNVTVRLPMGNQGDIVYTLERSKIDRIESAPVSYDFYDEKDIEEEQETIKSQKFSFENIIRAGLNMLGGKKGDEAGKINIQLKMRKLRAFITSSGYIGFLSDFLIVMLTIGTFNAFRKDTEISAKEIEKINMGSIFFKWSFFVGSLLFVQLQRFGSFNFTGSGIVSLLLLAVIFYETIGLFVLLIFKENYVKFLSRGKILNVMIFKIPIAIELTLFVYLLVMDIFILLI